MDKLLKKLSPTAKNKKENANVNTSCDMPQTGSEANGAGPSGERRETNAKKSTPGAARRKTTGKKPQQRGKRDNQDDDDQLCCVCETKTTEVLCCDHCDTWHCQTCAELPAEIIAQIGKFDSIKWFCPKCNDSVANMLRKQADTKNDIGSGEALMISQKLVSIEEGLSELRVVCDSQLAATNNIQEKISATIPNLTEHHWPSLGSNDTSEKKTQPPTHAPPVGSTAFTGGVQALTEFADRERRKNNIIIHNIAESTEDTAPLRETSDRTTIKDLIRNGTKLDDVNIEKLVRIGKRNPNRPRLLLVTLDCERTKILSNAWRLKNNTKWENTFIDPDRTLQEREEHKALRSELKSRRDAGEDNLVIRDGAIVKLPWHRRRPKTTSKQKADDKRAAAEQPQQDNQNQQQADSKSAGKPESNSHESAQKVTEHKNQPQEPETTQAVREASSEIAEVKATSNDQVEQPRGETPEIKWLSTPLAGTDTEIDDSDTQEDQHIKLSSDWDSPNDYSADTEDNGSPDWRVPRGRHPRGASPGTTPSRHSDVCMEINLPSPSISYAAHLQDTDSEYEADVEENDTEESATLDQIITCGWHPRGASPVIIHSSGAISTGSNPSSPDIRVQAQHSQGTNPSVPVSPYRYTDITSDDSDSKLLESEKHDYSSATESDTNISDDDKQQDESSLPDLGLSDEDSGDEMQEGCSRGSPHGGHPREANRSEPPDSTHNLPVPLKGNLLRVISTNCDSLLNKKDELLQLADTYQADIIMATEILPKNPGSPLTANDFLLQGYNIYTNLDDQAGRGIAIYINENLSHLVSSVETRSHFKESVWLSIRLKGKDCLQMGCIYRSPSSDPANNDNLIHLLEEVTASDPSHLLISGDFNYKGIDWDENTAETQEEKTFLDCVQDCFLHQHITEPTRYREGQTPSTLDLVMTNEEGMIANLTYLPGIGLSDHICLMFDLRTYTEKMPDTARYRYHRGDYDGINQELNSIDWDSQLADKNTEESWAYFADTFNNSMRKFIPKGHRKKVKKKKLWMTKDATRQQKKKYHAWKRFTETGAYADQLVARKEALALTHLTTRLRRSFEKISRKTPRKTLRHSGVIAQLKWKQKQSSAT